MDTKTIGEKLVRLRGNKGQSETAIALGISSSALSMYERGERIPRDEIKLKLARHYGTTVGELFYDQKVHE